MDRLDAARDKLDAATANPAEQLSDEKRRKMADKVKALLERQKAAVAEAESDSHARRPGKDVEAAGRDQLRRLARSGTDLADEVAKLEKEFAPLPVLARVIAESSTGDETRSPAPITNRTRTIDPTLAFDTELEAANDRKVMRPMTSPPAGWSNCSTRSSRTSRRPSRRSKAARSNRPSRRARLPAAQEGEGNRTSFRRSRS